MSESRRAVIVKPGIRGKHEPYAYVEDRGVEPMGWSMGKTFEFGQMGTAIYETSWNAGLWRFVPDDRDN